MLSICAGEDPGRAGSLSWLRVLFSEIQLLCFECIGAVRSGSLGLATTLAGQGESKSCSSCCLLRMQSWLSRSPPASLDISMTSSIPVMKSAYIGLPVLAMLAFRSVEAMCVLADAKLVRPALPRDCAFDERKDFVIDPAFANTPVKRGRRVARHPATILAPHSIVDQIPMLVASQKKSSTWVRPSTYRKRIIEQIQALAARQRINPTENLDLNLMFDFQRTTIGSPTKTRSVSVENAAVNQEVSLRSFQSQCQLHT